MRSQILKSIVSNLVPWLTGLILPIFSSCALGQIPLSPAPQTFIPYDDTRKTGWDEDFSLVYIPSSADTLTQRAFFFASTANDPAPLVVSLHTWSGDYSQNDELAALCKEKNINYIHPDFRGPNNHPDACISKLALSDIEDAITFALANSNADNSRIYVIGASGGGYATLASYMKLKYPVAAFSSWVPISDLEAWYYESLIRKNKYAGDVLACTSPGDTILNVENARERSPLFMETPLEKAQQSDLFIYTGVYDGIQGSVPITHAINFYNKLLTDHGVKDASKYVSDAEKLFLLEFRKPLGKFGDIDGREICLAKSWKNIHLTVFTGRHEMLPEFALSVVLSQKK